VLHTELSNQTTPPTHTRTHAHQQSLDATYADLSDEALKVLRRKLALSKQRMEWNTALYRVSRTINK
jgi:hypothetical protein